MANKMKTELFERKEVLLSSDVRERLETLSENVSLVTRQIKSGETSSVHCGSTLSLKEFHSRLSSAVNNVSSSCTNISLLFSSSPTPSLLEEVGILAAKLETACLSVASTLNQCRKEWGKYHYNEGKELIMAIFNGVSTLAKLIMKEGCKCNSKSRLQGTGSVWEHCERISKLSMNNKSAVVKVCLSQLQLLRDANNEMSELFSNNGVTVEDDLMTELLDGLQIDEKQEKAEDIGWNEEDKPLITSAIKLIQFTNDLTDRVCKNILQYTGYSNDDILYIQHLDNVADCIVKLSPLVDEVGSELEAPIDPKLLKEQSLSLCEELLYIVAYLNENDKDQNWKDVKVKLNTLKDTL